MTHRRAPFLTLAPAAAASVFAPQTNNNNAT